MTKEDYTILQTWDSLAEIIEEQAREIADLKFALQVSKAQIRTLQSLSD